MNRFKRWFKRINRHNKNKINWLNKNNSYLGI